MKPKSKLAITLMFVATTASAESSEIADMMRNLDTIWIVLAAVLVFFMQAGFALLEVGSSRAKNSINVMMKNYFDCCMASVVFWLVGYGLMFGNSPSGYIGTNHFFVTDGSGLDFATILFQAMFAATAATIASGAMAERTKFTGYIFCATLITALIYPIFGSWVWNNNGWLAQLGFTDFAGSTVVHSVGAWCALAGVLAIGPRVGRFAPNTGEARDIPGHNLSMVALGGFILWFGWFGFNAGSTLGINDQIGLIALNTHLAAAAGGIGIVLFQYLRNYPVTLVGCVNGSLGGLVSITAGCATMHPLFAIISGLVGGIVVLFGTRLLLKFKIDDVVGAIPVHGFAGIWGTLAAGIFYSGDLFNPTRIGVQIVGIVTAFFWTMVTATIVFRLVKKVVGLRSEPAHEIQGLDFSEHTEVGYPEFHQLTQNFKS